MSLQDILLRAQREIVASWFQCILATYPADTAKFLKRDTDPFQNPVGQTIRSALEDLLNALIEGADPDAVRSHLDSIIRIRAVQDFTPAEAVGFMFQLKPLIRSQLGSTSRQNGELSALNDLEARIDAATLLAFDIYMECREQVYAIKAGSLRRRTELLLERTFKKGGDDR